MAHTWHAVDLRTGKRGPQLQMMARGSVSRIIGEATDTQASVLCWDQGQPVPEWRYWTQPGRMMAVLVDDDDRPLWGGLIVRRTTDAGIWAPVAMTTLEHYLDRRYATSSSALTFFAQDQADIAAAIVAATVPVYGVPFVINAQPTGVLRDRTYLDSEDKTALSLLTDLMNLNNGIEFTVDLEWSDATNTVLSYILRISGRIGKSLPRPTRFEHPGPVVSFTVIEDFTKENGANDVMAVSSGEGDARPQSSHATDPVNLGAGWARYERRWTPSTSISDVSTLDSYAMADLALKRNGLTEMTLMANLDSSPRLNVDWWLGDDITVAITSPAYPVRYTTNGQAVPGYERTARVVGWDIDLDARTLTPHLREYSLVAEPIYSESR